MKIWVDADACPTAIREIICKVAQRKQIKTTFIANQFLRLPPSSWLRFSQVPHGFDEADNEIVKRCAAADLIITADIPLAAQCIEKECRAVTFRGEAFDKSNITSRLAMRDFMDTLRSSGVETGGPSALSNKEKQQFSNQLEKLTNQ